VSAAVIAKTAGGTAGHVRAGGSYMVLADIGDSGNPASGTSSVTANVAALTAGRTAAPLSPGSYRAGGGTYTHGSASLTVDAAKPEGTYSFSLALADAAGNTATRTGLTVTVDNTAPTASDVQTANVTGGTARRAEAGDRITFTYSEPIDPTTILPAWTGAATTVVVRVTNGASNTLTVRNAANSGVLPLGSVNLGRSDYVTGTRDFTASQMTMAGAAITIMLGAPNGSTTTAAGNGTMTWTPSATVTDRAGNPASAAARTESGSADGEF
jgi:hypothetical protein